MAERILILHDDRMLDHINGPGHPERPDRVRAILRALHREPIEGLEWAQPQRATIEQVRRVHSIAHVDRIDMMKGKTARLDADTGISPGSTVAAYLAAGAGIQAVDALMTGACKRVYALVRPPGHHAERHHAMGFCLFNNIAIAAEHARLEHGVQRVLIVDFDVHHCNGTQQAFYKRNDVLVFSSHRYPFYPGTGWVDEIGEGEGRGYTVNIPLMAGMGNETVAAVYHALLPPIAEQFKPQLVLVSAGYDAHLYDPLGGLRMTEAGFGSLSGLLAEVADTYADGRLAYFLEGGYDLDALAQSTRACLTVMKGEDPPTVGEEHEQSARLLAQVRNCIAPYWLKPEDADDSGV